MRLTRRAVFCLLAMEMSISTLCHTQQYMKVAPITDTQFDDWIQKGQLVKCHAFAHTVYPAPPKGMAFDPNEARKPSGICYWDIDRAAELAPPLLVVHANTRILVRVKNLRQNETITPAVVFAKIVPPSPGNDILKNAVNPLQALTPIPVVHNEARAEALPPPPPPDPCDTTTQFFDADRCQSQLSDQINSIQTSINHANAALACLESYQVAVDSDPLEGPNPCPKIRAYTCTASRPINTQHPNEDFGHQKECVITGITTATRTLAPPAATLTTLDAFISKDPVKYSGQIAFDAVLKNGISAIQTAQGTLQQASLLLQAMPDSIDNKIYYFDVPHLTTATVTITGTEIVSKTNSTISTWTVNSTSYDVVFSAGLGFSNLVYRTFANTPQVQNGHPVLNSSGNVISKVTETDTNLSVLAPEVLGGYVIPGLQKFHALCSFGCSLLVSGGIGANLTTKSADFDTGISLRLADVLITPAVHFGRETRLIDGITVGEQIGANAPSSLPTKTKWVRKLGIVLTYNIPLP